MNSISYLDSVLSRSLSSSRAASGSTTPTDAASTSRSALGRRSSDHALPRARRMSGGAATGAGSPFGFTPIWPEERKRRDSEKSQRRRKSASTDTSSDGVAADDAESTSSSKKRRSASSKHGKASSEGMAERRAQMRRAGSAPSSPRGTTLHLVHEGSGATRPAPPRWGSLWGLGSWLDASQVDQAAERRRARRSRRAASEGTSRRATDDDDENDTDERNDVAAAERALLAHIPPEMLLSEQERENVVEFEGEEAGDAELLLHAPSPASSSARLPSTPSLGSLQNGELGTPDEIDSRTLHDAFTQSSSSGASSHQRSSTEDSQSSLDSALLPAPAHPDRVPSPPLLLPRELRGDYFGDFASQDRDAASSAWAGPARTEREVPSRSGTPAFPPGIVRIQPRSAVAAEKESQTEPMADPDHERTPAEHPPPYSESEATPISDNKAPASSSCDSTDYPRRAPPTPLLPPTSLSSLHSPPSPRHNRNANGTPVWRRVLIALHHGIVLVLLLPVNAVRWLIRRTTGKRTRTASGEAKLLAVHELPYEGQVREGGREDKEKSSSDLPRRTGSLRFDSSSHGSGKATLNDTRPPTPTPSSSALQASRDSDAAAHVVADQETDAEAREKEAREQRRAERRKRREEEQRKVLAELERNGQQLPSGRDEEEPLTEEQAMQMEARRTAEASKAGAGAPPLPSPGTILASRLLPNPSFVDPLLAHDGTAKKVDGRIPPLEGHGVGLLHGSSTQIKEAPPISRTSSDASLIVHSGARSVASTAQAPSTIPRGPTAPAVIHDSPKILVLDLDETLIHSTSRSPAWSAMRSGTSAVAAMSLGGGGGGSLLGFDGLGGLLGLGDAGSQHRRVRSHQVEVVLDGRSVIYHVYKRPWVDYFLRKVAAWYHVVIFTASVQEYGDPVIDWLDQGRGLISGRLFRDACTYKNGSYLKNLRVVDRDLSRVCLVDNSPASYAINPANGIPIEGWTHDPNDEALLDLLPVLDSLRFATDVRHILGVRGFAA